LNERQPPNEPSPDRPTEGFPSAPSSEPEIAVRNYRLRQLVATGGMGEVYEADQLRPIKRRVALKVVKLGMDTREVVARFESERQALALMNHPNIANVFDGGATDQGRPFFAMEFVQGEPITDYCDRYKLATRQRLELFLDVCSGTQHAHQKGIIHRDLKPSNVLVTIQDDRSVPKIIDFGVAKATSQRLTEKTMVTSLGMVIGTPEYMSPEQANLTGLDIDTRTDVYALGMLLYELMAGALPFDAKKLRQAGFAELQRHIVEEETPKPSTRLTALGDSAVGIARSRSAEISTLTRELRGDLDWIILKALEKDRTRRYATANALAQDIRRHLNNEPVLASPPSNGYRARKFVQRHRAGVTVAALLAAVLLAGIVGTTIGLVRAVRAERRAFSEAQTARQVSDFLVDLFRVADPSTARGAEITAREILDDGARRIESELAGQPTTQARMMGTIGTVYQNLGLYGEAQPLLEQALALREDHVGANSLETAESLFALGVQQRRAGEYAEAQALTERSLAIRKSKLPVDDPLVARTIASLGWAMARQEKHDEAKALFEEALEIREGSLSPDHPDLAESLKDLGIFRWRQGDFSTAEPLLRRALSIFETSLGTDDYRVRDTLNDLAILYWTQARYAEAQALYERSLIIRERVLGPDHPEIATTLNNLALLFDAQNLQAKAKPLLERAHKINRERLGVNHDKTAMTLANLAWIQYRDGQYDDAIALYERALVGYENSIGPDHTRVAILLRDEARLFIDQQRWSRAEELLQRASDIWKGALGVDHPEVAETSHLLAGVYYRQEKTSAAEELFAQALEIRREKLGAAHPAFLETLEEYANLLRETGRDHLADDLVAEHLD
jgi:non-specific serine/threonine protein kinase/serine/threonine-protein kinase